MLSKCAAAISAFIARPAGLALNASIIIWLSMIFPGSGDAASHIDFYFHYRGYKPELTEIQYPNPENSREYVISEHWRLQCHFFHWTQCSGDPAYSCGRKLRPGDWVKSAAEPPMSPVEIFPNKAYCPLWYNRSKLATDLKISVHVPSYEYAAELMGLMGATAGAKEHCNGWRETETTARAMSWVCFNYSGLDRAWLLYLLEQSKINGRRHFMTTSTGQWSLFSWPLVLFDCSWCLPGMRLHIGQRREEIPDFSPFPYY